MITTAPKIYLNTMMLQLQLESIAGILDENEFFGYDQCTITEFLEGITEHLHSSESPDSYSFTGETGTIILSIGMKDVSSDGNHVMMHPEIVQVHLVSTNNCMVKKLSRRKLLERIRRELKVGNDVSN